MIWIDWRSVEGCRNWRFERCFGCGLQAAGMSAWKPLSVSLMERVRCELAETAESETVLDWVPSAAAAFARSAL